MAITIISEPQTYTPAYNEQVFLVSGTNTAYNSYKYVFDLYDAAGARITAIPSIKIPARPTDGWCVFDAQRIVENYVGSDIALETSGTAGFKQNTNSYYGYKVKVGEEFDVTTSGVTTYAAMATSSTIYAYNGVFNFVDFQSYDDDDYACSQTVLQMGQFLTNNRINPTGSSATRTTLISSDSNAWLYFFYKTSGLVDRMTITVTDSDLSNSTYYIQNTYTSSSVADKFLRIPTGTRNLNYIPNSSIISGGVQPIIKSTTVFYSISLADSSSSLVGEAYDYLVQDTIVDLSAGLNYPAGAQFYYSRGCKYPSYRVHFLNKLGGFDSFTFNGVVSKNEEITRSTYKKLHGTTSGAYSYNTYDRGTTIFDVSINDKITLNSDWINETEATWLEELFSSPEVYIEDNDNLVAVVPLSTSYETKTSVNNKMFNITIEMEYSQKRYRQRF